MFAYSFLAMTAYNILKPITRSQFISQLGADNIPYIPLVAAIAIGVIMQGYSRAAGIIPPRWVIPVAQGAMAGLLVMFWFLFQTGNWMVAAGFYFFGLIMGILLISQFWTLANEIYDARQAKRLFGFIGAGASLGGIAGSSLLAFAVGAFGTNNLLLVSAGLLGVAAVLVLSIEARSPVQLAAIAKAGEEKGVGGAEAFRMLRESRHLQVISLVIAFGAIGAYLIEQQLNMAAEAFKGRGAVDSLTAFLGTVQLYTSMAGFLIQVLLTSRIHRQLGIGFALLILPVSLGTSAAIMLANAVLWAPALARVFDTSLRYTVDKTTREILFLPLPGHLKRQAKPFVDVTVDRTAKGIGGLLALRADRAVGPELGLAARQLRQPGRLRLSGSSRPSRPSRATSTPSARDSPAATSSPTRCGCRPPTRRRSRRWSPSWPIPTRRASAMPSTCSSRSTSAT